MRIVTVGVIAAIFTASALATAVHPQTPPSPEAARPTPVRSVLALVRLASVVDTPLHFRLVRVSLGSGQATSYTGAQGFVYPLSGTLAVSLEGEGRTLRAGDAAYVGTGQRATLRATGGEAAVFLHFMLPSAAELGGPVEGEPAVVTELYRTTAPISSLKPRPYEFTLTRVTFPPRMPPNPPHYRSGAALYYVLSGPGTMVVDGKSDAKAAGTPVYEPYGFVHQWGNPNDRPLVLLQANISPEGVPVVIMGAPPAGSN